MRLLRPPGPNRPGRAGSCLKNTLNDTFPAIQWALDKYAEKSAADLELLPTIVCAYREASQARRQMAFEELGRKVKPVKPRFSDATILRNINELARDGMLVVSSAHE
jgi:hypothetical protein